MDSEQIIKQHTKIMLDSIEQYENENNQILDNWIYNLRVMLQYQDYILENGYIEFDKYIESQADIERWSKEDARVEQEV